MTNLEKELENVEEMWNKGIVDKEFYEHMKNELKRQMQEEAETIAKEKRKADEEHLRQFAEKEEAKRRADEEAREIFERGKEYSLKNDFDNAIRECTEAIKYDPEYAEAYFVRGYSWNMKSEFSSGLKDLRQAIRFDPKNPNYYFHCSMSYKFLNQYGEAIESLLDALKIDPQFSNAVSALKQIEEEDVLKRNVDRVIDEISKADNPNTILEMSKDPQKILDFMVRQSYYSGLTNIKRGNFKLAIDDFTKEINNNPDFADAYCARSIVYSKLGMDEQAQNDIEIMKNIYFNDSIWMWKEYS